MTIDVEDWFHVSAFAGTIDRADWPSLESRVEANTDRLLALFEAAGVRGTFFTLGCVARAHPALVQRIHGAGHEIASHGDRHHRVQELSPDAFAADVDHARKTLQDMTGAPVEGYRAPSFSIGPHTPRAYEALARAGHGYSSSISPIAHDHYGDPHAPLTPCRDPATGILEIPVTALTVLGRRWPAGGGGFFRVLPGAWFRAALRRAEAEGRAANFYLHPWEIDPGQPRVNGAPLRSRLRHYAGLSRCAARFARHLDAARWGRMDDIYTDPARS